MLFNFACISPCPFLHQKWISFVLPKSFCKLVQNSHIFMSNLNKYVWNSFFHKRNEVFKWHVNNTYENGSTLWFRKYRETGEKVSYEVSIPFCYFVGFGSKYIRKNLWNLSFSYIFFSIFYFTCFCWILQLGSKKKYWNNFFGFISIKKLFCRCVLFPTN